MRTTRRAFDRKPATHRRDAGRKPTQAADRELRELGVDLIHGRRIPNYYFRRVMRDAGLISPKETRPNPRTWVTEDGRVKLTTREEKLQALIVFRTITEHLKTQPPHETHLQARIRAKRELEDLQRHRMPQSTIAARLGSTVKSLQGLLGFRGTEDTYTTQCPWEILTRLETTDWTETLAEQTQGMDPTTTYSISDGEIQHQRHRAREAERVLAQTERHYIEFRGTCWRCGATWSSLNQSGRLQDATEMTCRMCGRLSYVRHTDATP